MKLSTMFLALLLTTTSICSSASDTTTAIAVYKIKSEAISNEFVTSLSDHIESILLGLPNYRVIARTNLDVLISEDRLHVRGVIQHRDSVGTITAIDKICTGSVSRTGTNYNFTLKLIDVESGRIDAIAQRFYSGPADGLFGVADTLVGVICPQPEQWHNDTTTRQFESTAALAILADSVNTASETSGAITLPASNQAAPDTMEMHLRPGAASGGATIADRKNLKTFAKQQPSKLGRQIGIGAVVLFATFAALLLIFRN